MDALEQAWFARADRDSVVAEELEALEDRAEPDFTRLKVALACMLAALAMLVLPMLKPSPRFVPPPIALAKQGPEVVAVAAPAKPQVKTKVKAAKSKRVPGKLVARK